MANDSVSIALISADVRLWLDKINPVGSINPRTSNLPEIFKSTAFPFLTNSAPFTFAESYSS